MSDTPSLSEAEAELRNCRAARDGCLRQRNEAVSEFGQIVASKERFDQISAQLQETINTTDSDVKRKMATVELCAHLSGTRARRKGLTDRDPQELDLLEIKRSAAVRLCAARLAAANQALREAAERVRALKARARDLHVQGCEAAEEGASADASPSSFNRRDSGDFDVYAALYNAFFPHYGLLGV